MILRQVPTVSANGYDQWSVKGLRTVWLAVPVMFVLAPPAGASDWPQFNFDGQHSGNNPSETAIQKSNVATLHVRYHVTLPSIADGAPAFLEGISTSQGIKDVLFLNTKDGRILALDAATGTMLWSQRPATGPRYTTSSPAADRNRLVVYAYALDGRVHKYNAGDGTEVTTGGWPELATLKPTVEKGSSALSLVTTVGGTTFLYVTNGGYPGDAGDYQGHVTSIDVSTGAQRVFNTDCSDLACHLEENGSGVNCSQLHPDCPHVQSAVWARAGVVYSAPLDRIFFATGNGDYDANLGGFDWGDSVLAIHPDGTGTGPVPVDSYTPTEFQILQNEDADLGSTSPAILPAVPGSNIAQLGVQGQKVSSAGGKLRLLNLSNLSGSGGPGHVGGEIQKIDVPQGGEVLTAPAVWANPSDGSVWVFYANDSGISGLKIVVDGGGSPSIAPQWTDGTGGTSPILANGILYYASVSGVRALEPTTGGQLWSDGGTIGGLHWESQIVVNGRLYVTDEGAQLWAFDVVPSIAINDVSVAEPNSGTTNAVFTLSLTNPSNKTIGVSYQTADGSATAGVDYQVTSGTAIFPPLSTSQTITVPVIGDRISDADKTFFVNLSGATNASIVRTQGVGTILNANAPGLSVNDTTAAEGTTAVFTVTLSPTNPTQTVTVNYATADGTATAGLDYQSASGTLSFPPGTATQPINVVVSVDPAQDGPETFFVNLSGATNAAIAYSQGVGTIGTACSSPYIVVPDGRLTPSVIPARATVWFGASVTTGNSYSVEFKNVTGNNGPPGSLTVFKGTDLCSGRSSLSSSDSATVDPGESTAAVRVSFTATGTNPLYRLSLLNGAAIPVSYTLRVSETTQFSPAWSTNGSFDTFYSFLNTTGASLSGTLSLLDPTGGVLATLPLAIPAGQTATANTASMGVPRNRTGTARFTHNGPPGAMEAEAAIANFSISPAYVQPVKFQAAREAR